MRPSSAMQGHCSTPTKACRDIVQGHRAGTSCRDTVLYYQTVLLTLAFKSQCGSALRLTPRAPDLAARSEPWPSMVSLQRSPLGRGKGDPLP